MLHPKVARIDCEDCKRHSYNLRTGERNEYEVDDGKMLPVVRNKPPPCEVCPKKSPERGKRLMLRPENRQMLDFYFRYKAVPHRKTQLLDCPITQRNIRLIDTALEVAKSRQLSRVQRKARRSE